MDLDTTIVGAGPYGLSIAAHLRPKGHAYRVYGRAMESWRTFMPHGMMLKSEPFASNLWDPARRFTLERYCHEQRIDYRPMGRPLSLELFLKYADWFQHSIGEAPEEVDVTRLQRHTGGFALELADGRRLTSRHVVIATGHMTYCALPEALKDVPEPQVAHSSRMTTVGSYAGRDVTLIGAGQAALETAALLHEAGAHVRLLVRDTRVQWWGRPSFERTLLERLKAPDAALSRGWKSMALAELPRLFRRFPAEKRHRFVADSFGPGGAWWLRDRVDGRIEIRVQTRVEHASLESGRVRLRLAGPAGISELLTDHVIAATGYTVDIDRVSYLDPDLRRSIVREAGGIPALSPNFESSVPGLYFVGLASAPVFGPVMRFMYGAKHTAPLIAKALGTR